MSQGPPPKFAFGGERKKAEPGSASLTDIFDDFLFPGGDRFVTNKPSGNQSGDDDEDGDDDSYDADEFGETDGKKKRKRVRVNQKNMSEEQKIERR